VAPATIIAFAVVGATRPRSGSPIATIASAASTRVSSAVAVDQAAADGAKGQRPQGRRSRRVLVLPDKPGHAGFVPAAGRERAARRLQGSRTGVQNAPFAHVDSARSLLSRGPVRAARSLRQRRLKRRGSTRRPRRDCAGKGLVGRHARRRVPVGNCECPARPLPTVPCLARSAPTGLRDAASRNSQPHAIPRTTSMSPMSRVSACLLGPARVLSVPWQSRPPPRSHDGNPRRMILPHCCTPAEMRRPRRRYLDFVTREGKPLPKRGRGLTKRSPCRQPSFGLQREVYAYEPAG